jgi:hypothetical protein
MKAADSIGTDKILAQLDELAFKHGARFKAAAALRWLGENRRSIADTKQFEASSQPMMDTKPVAEVAQSVVS